MGAMAASRGRGAQLPIQLLILLIVDPLGGAIARRLNSYAGPYIINIRELMDCPESEVGPTEKAFTIKGIMHYNQTLKEKVWDGNATVSDTGFRPGMSTITIYISKWNNVAGWRDNFVIMPLGDACFAAFEIAIDLVEHLADHIENVPRKCPIPGGVFHIRNVPVRAGQLKHFPVFPYGRFRADIKGFYPPGQEERNKNICCRGCIRVVMDVIPK